MKYNEIKVPEIIPTNRIMSAFSNEIDPYKVEQYTQDMSEKMLSHTFPPIMGFPTFLTSEDVGSEFMSGEPITENEVGLLVWVVTNGHHRTYAAINARLPYLPVQLDYSCITNEQELNQF